jgi:hypothetical protein
MGVIGAANGAQKPLPLVRKLITTKILSKLIK